MPAWVGLLVLVVFAMVPIGFVLVSRVHRILRKRHPETYRELGSPTLFLNNSILNGWLFLRFLVTGAW